MEGIKIIRKVIAKETNPQNAQMRPSILPQTSLNEVMVGFKDWLSILVKSVGYVY